MSPTDLWVTYKKVKQRIKRAKSVETRRKAEAMARIAKRIRDQPSPDLLGEFRKAEDDWIKSWDVSISAVRLADEFEKAIQSGEYVVIHPPIKTPSLGFDPERGIVYCAEISSEKGQLKIGSTTMTMRDRLAKYRTKYRCPAKEIFSMYVTFPARVEKRAHELLRGRRLIGSGKGDSNERFATDAETAIRAIQAAALELRVEIFQNRIGNK
jgi:hypothetical protein